MAPVSRTRRCGGRGDRCDRDSHRCCGLPRRLRASMVNASKRSTPCSSSRSPRGESTSSERAGPTPPGSLSRLGTCRSHKSWRTGTSCSGIERRQVLRNVRRGLSDRGLRVVKTSVRAPRANAFAKRWVGTVRRECLDHVLIFGRRHHLQRVLHAYAEHYNPARPHRSIDLRPPDPAPSAEGVAARESDGEMSSAGSFMSTSASRHDSYQSFGARHARQSTGVSNFTAGAVSRNPRGSRGLPSVGFRAGLNQPRRKPAGHAADRNKCTLHGFGVPGSMTDEWAPGPQGRPPNRQWWISTLAYSPARTKGSS